MTKAPKLLMATPSYAPELTGVGRYAGELARGLVSRGYDVSVVTTPPHYPGWYVREPYKNDRYDVETVDGVHIWRCPIFIPRRASGLYRLLSSLSFALSALPVLMWRVIFHRPDIVLCVEPTLAVAPALIAVAKLVGAPCVLHVQDIELDAAIAVGHLRLTGRALRVASKIDTLIRRRFNRVITISGTMVQNLVRKGVDPSKIRLIRNWVDTDRIRPMGGASKYRQELGLKPDEIVCLYSGQIGRKQALDLVLQAAAKLANVRRFRFVIAGDGPELPVLKDRYGYLPNVTFLPLQPEERLGEFLNLADVHLLPQHAGVGELVLPSKVGGMLASGGRILVTAEHDSELGAFLSEAADIVPPGNADLIAAALVRMSQTADSTQPSRLALAKTISSNTCLSLFDQTLREVLYPSIST